MFAIVKVFTETRRRTKVMQELQDVTPLLLEFEAARKSGTVDPANTKLSYSDTRQLRWKSQTTTASQDERNGGPIHFGKQRRRGSVRSPDE